MITGQSEDGGLRVKAMAGSGSARWQSAYEEGKKGSERLSNGPANIFSGDDELSGLNCFTQGVGRVPAQEWGEEMRCLRVSVQAGLTPDRLGPRPDRSSAALGSGPSWWALHADCTDAFRAAAGGRRDSAGDAQPQPVSVTREKDREKNAQRRSDFISRSKSGSEDSDCLITWSKVFTHKTLKISC